MAKKETAVVMVPLTSIRPDENQPRKTFDAARLNELMSSIRTHGIMNPLIIEQQKEGEYILVDGERRYRAAKEMRLTEVPAIIVPKQTMVERLIQQFHLQEQHENWSPVEKAVAVAQLAEELGMGVAAMAQTLSLPTRTISDYVAFSKVADKKAFMENKIPISYARAMVELRGMVRNTWAKHDKEFTADMERDLERAVIARILAGTIRKASELTKIKDSVRTDHTSIVKFLKNDALTTERLFIDSNAKGSWYFRNLVREAYAIASHARSGRAAGVAAIFREDEAAKKSIAGAIDALKELYAEIK